jgi:hypothetical protein
MRVLRTLPLTVLEPENGVGSRFRTLPTGERANRLATPFSRPEETESCEELRYGRPIAIVDSQRDDGGSTAGRFALQLAKLHLRPLEMVRPEVAVQIEQEGMPG